ncbi:MAG: Omp28-related outer membrane protein [Prevotellaceae bacterium]|nr:Omp28-related outer membrane protein [Prevotellaceae bacterium]
MRISKIIISFVMALSLTTAMAQEDGQMIVSYCDGEVASSSTIGSTGERWIEAATYVPAQELSEYVNLKVAGINAGLASRINVDTLVVWVRKNLTDNNIFETTIYKGGDPDILKGWNSLSGTPCSLDTENGIYIGYSIKQKGTCYAVSAVGEDREGGLFVNMDGNWQDRSAEGLGTLSVEMIIQADNLPTYDLSIETAEIPERVKISSSMPVGIYVKNKASKTITGFDVACEIEGLPAITKHVEQTFKPNDIQLVSLDFDVTTENKASNVPVTISIANLNEGEDINPENNSITETVNIVKYDFVRSVLMEEFTTESCSFCPTAASDLHTVLSEDKYSSNVLVIAHHSGYGTDWLTTPADRSYLWFYDNNGTYAPAFMYDRYAFGNNTPVTSGTSGTDVIKEFLDARIAEPTHIALFPTAVYDETTSKIKVNVTGGRDEIEEDLRITVCAVEDNITAKNQNNGGSNFIHQHVLRSYNEIWGDEITWDENDDFEYNCEIDYSNEWKKEDTKVIVFISAYNQSDNTKCAVNNAAQADIVWESTGISMPEATDSSVVFETLYDLEGRVVSTPSKGQLYLKRTVYNNGTSKTIKLIAK